MSESSAGNEGDAERFIYEHIREAPRQQIEFGNQLDDKMLRIFGAATVLVGLLGLSTLNVSGSKVLFLLLPLAPFTVTAIAAFRHINPDTYHWAMRASELPKSWNEEEANVRHALLGEIGRAYCRNQKVLKDKAWYVRFALISTSIEVALVVAALILYRI